MSENLEPRDFGDLERFQNFKKLEELQNFRWWARLGFVWISLLLGFTFLLLIFLVYLLVHSFNTSFDKQNDIFKIISTNQTHLAGQLIHTNQLELIKDSAHMVTVLVGTARVMQIQAENFSIKNGVLECRALGHTFYIYGGMHSIVIEEIKPGIPVITAPKPTEKNEEGRLGKAL